MAKIVRESVLGLVESANKYHSCILLTYSLDFYYFENQIINEIKRSGVTNICVLADSNMLQQTLGILTSRTLDNSSRYSLTSIRQYGAFHPKILMYFGEDSKCFLSIGSGNLTSTGHGKNLECWGAFHIDGKDDPMLPLFYNVYDYVKSVSKNAEGFAKKKFEWIETYSPWLKERGRSHSSIKLDDGVDAYFLSNTKSSMMAKISEIIPLDDIQRIKVLSPYYDQDGRTLKRLQEIFPNAQITAVMQPCGGYYPVKISEKHLGRISWLEWIYESSGEKNVINTRFVHAKMIQFESEKMNYCLMGSANCTEAALGQINKGAKNSEASILLVKEGKDWFKELGVFKHTKKINIEEVKAFSNPESDDNTTANEPNQIYIKSVDLVGNNLTLYLESELKSSDITIVLLDSSGKVKDIVNTHSVNGPVIDTKIDYKESMKICVICKKNTNDVLSNKVLISNVDKLYITDPNPENRKIEYMLNRIKDGNGDIVTLLTILDPSKVVLENKLTGKDNGGSSDSKKQNKGPQGKTITFEEYQRSEFGIVDAFDGNLITKQNTNRIIEVLKTLLDRVHNEAGFYDEEIDKDSVETSLGREDLGSQDNRLILKNKSEFESQKRRIKNLFSSYLKPLDKRMRLGTNALHLDISFYSVLLYTLIEFYNKQIIYSSNISTMPKGYLIYSTKNMGNDGNNFNYLVSCVVGDFATLLRNSESGFKNAKNNSKFIESVKLAFELTCCALSLLDIKDASKSSNKKIILWALYGNLRESLYQNEDIAATFSFEDHCKAIGQLSDIFPHHDKDSLVSTFKKLEIQYQEFQKVKKKKQNYEVGDLVYSNEIGYCYVFTKSNGTPFLVSHNEKSRIKLNAFDCLGL